MLFALKTSSKLVIDLDNIVAIKELDFSERHSSEEPTSRDDRQFQIRMKVGIHQCGDGYYELPLPFRDDNPLLPNNRALAWHRLRHFERKLNASEQYRQDCSTAFMSDIISNGYAENVSSASFGDFWHVWYIPHHEVYHPKNG